MFAVALALGAVACEEPKKETPPPAKEGAMKEGAMKEGAMKEGDMKKEGGMAEGVKKVGGADMFPTKNIIENAVNSPIHKTLVAAVQAAGLVDTLKGAGPFTVLAPVDDAFAKLPKGTVEGLLKPEKKADLTKVLTYHVIAGKHSGADILKEIEEGKGKHTYETVSKGKLIAEKEGDKIVFVDEGGHKSTVTVSDVNQSNGVIHVVDTVLLPK
jgi:uncharacterized surface protein with fasciclin (FAS1) repeats